MFFFKKIITVLILTWKKKKFIIFQSPPKNNFLVIDDISIEHLKKVVINDLDFLPISIQPYLKNFETNQQGETYYLSLKIIFYFIQGRLKKLNYRSSYIYSCIKCSKPKLVLNNCHDWNLINIAKEFKKVKFVMLCHGSWFNFTELGDKFYKEHNLTTMPIEMSKIKIEDEIDNFYMIVNGKKDLELFEKIGINNNINKIKLLSVGSCEASYYQTLKLSNDKKYDILFISQVVEQNFMDSKKYKFDKIFFDQTKIVLGFLSKYALKKKLSVAYLCRLKTIFTNEEINFAKDILSNGCDYKIIENKNNPLWETIYSSKIITTVDSTCGYDSIAVKKKTMLFPLFFSDKFIFATNPDRKLEKIWKWTVTDNDYRKFEALMDELFFLDQEKYEDQIKQSVNYLFDNTKNIPAHKFVYNFIKTNIA